MLDDEVFRLMDRRPYYAVLGPEFFVSSAGYRTQPGNKKQWSFCYNLRIVQELKKAESVWKLIYAARDPDDVEILEHLRQYGIRVPGLIQQGVTPEEVIRDTITGADVVFAPQFTSKQPWRTKYRSPQTPSAAVAAMVYFAVSLVPLDSNSLNGFLDHYESPVNLRPA